LANKERKVVTPVCNSYFRVAHLWPSAEATSAAEALETDRASASAIEKRIAAAKNLTAQREAQVKEAQTAPQQVIDAQANSQSKSGELEQTRADVRTAELHLGYTKIYAPVNVVIGRKTVELGQRIQPGQMLLAIVPVDDIWVTANFKETQLNHMRPGERVTTSAGTSCPKPRADVAGRRPRGSGAAR
jgi:membrane fusion protein (multidrug efflux system)